jgi:glycosyltransferase involved in cell wall biosynthesis
MRLGSRRVPGTADLRLAVVSPFLDRRHGTERCIVEQLERIGSQPGVEIHAYCQRVDDLNGVVPYAGASAASRIFWHKVPEIRGPHLLEYLWWFIANRWQRWWDSRIKRLRYDLLYSPGINALDADAITVHIVFREFYERVRSQLSFRAAPAGSWPSLLHRLLYYRLIIALERRVYRRVPALAAVSASVASQIAKYFQRSDVAVIRNGVDTVRFSPSLRLARRAAARDQFALSTGDFVLLFIGNDWRKKGLRTLLQALSSSAWVPFKLLVIGTDAQKPYQTLARSPEMAGRVRFLGPSPDVLQFYAAADAYVGPSLEDAYGLPVVEAMACGLPVIASSRAGASEIIEHLKNGLVLQDPEDPEELAELLRSMYSDAALRERLGDAAFKTAQRYSWDDNAAATWEWLQKAAARLRAKSSGDTR